MTTQRLDIEVPTLARVEGEGALEFSVEAGRIEQMRLRIYEPPRFFEKFLEGRSYRDLPDAEARICGICPVAYQSTAVQAVEQAFAVEVPEDALRLRRLLYCGEWLQSHSLHIHALAAPDFLGCNNIIEMAAGHGEAVRRGLRLQALGNQIMRVLGGRSVHPVNVCSGGLHKRPDPASVRTLKTALRAAWWDSEELISWLGGLELPEHEAQFTCVSLREETLYPIDRGRIVSDRGLDLDPADYEQHFREFQVPHSTAFHSHLDGEPYLVGPLARVNLNLDRLPAEVLAPLELTDIRFPSRNMFHSIVARAVEIRYAIHEARRLIREWQDDAPVCGKIVTRAGTGFGATEAPRGLLWHRYDFDDQGRVLACRIVPPTSQNQARIEADLAESLTAFGLDRDADALRLHAEKVIRNYDPCISCATHFLTLNLHRPTDGLPGTAAGTGRPLQIIAVGSPQDGDDIAWRVADRLRASYPQLAIETADRPGLDLLSLLRPAARNLVLDAATGLDGTQPVLLPASALTDDADRLSAHGLGIATAIGLGSMLGDLPPDTALVALPGDGAAAPATLAEAVAALLGM